MEIIQNGRQTFFFIKLITLFLFAINWICLLHIIATENSSSFTLGFEYARLKSLCFCLWPNFLTSFSLNLHFLNEYFCWWYMQHNMLPYGTGPLCIYIVFVRWRVGSVVRALDCKSKGRGLESRQEHKKNLGFFSVSKRLCWLAAQLPCIYACIRKTMYAH